LLAAGQVSAKLFKTTEFTLNNGMQVVVIENHKAPIIKHMVWYKVGATDEIRGKDAAAHLLEHLMFRGTKGVADGKFNQWMNAIDYLSVHN
jgi:zinc protease